MKKAAKLIDLTDYTPVKIPIPRTARGERRLARRMERRLRTIESGGLVPFYKKRQSLGAAKHAYVHPIPGWTKSWELISAPKSFWKKWVNSMGFLIEKRIKEWVVLSPRNEVLVDCFPLDNYPDGGNTRLINESNLVIREFIAQQEWECTKVKPLTYTHKTGFVFYEGIWQAQNAWVIEHKGRKLKYGKTRQVNYNMGWPPFYLTLKVVNDINDGIIPD